MDWVNLSVAYETYTIKEVGSDYFTLVGQHHTITYSLIQ
jgi:hypothetical protein